MRLHIAVLSLLSAFIVSSADGAGLRFRMDTVSKVVKAGDKGFKMSKFSKYGYGAGGKNEALVLTTSVLAARNGWASPTYADSDSALDNAEFYTPGPGCPSIGKNFSFPSNSTPGGAGETMEAEVYNDPGCVFTKVPYACPANNMAGPFNFQWRVSASPHNCLAVGPTSDDMNCHYAAEVRNDTCDDELVGVAREGLDYENINTAKSMTWTMTGGWHYACVHNEAWDNTNTTFFYEMTNSAEICRFQR